MILIVCCDMCVRGKETKGPVVILFLAFVVGGAVALEEGLGGELGLTLVL